MFAAHREWLAWRPARHKVNVFRKRAVVKFLDIVIKEAPRSNWHKAALLIYVDGNTRVFITLNDHFMLKACFVYAKGESPGASEKLNRLHCHAPFLGRYMSIYGWVF
jgi:hypothetical protein